MIGNNSSLGIFYLASKGIFKYIEKSNTRDYSLHASYIEVYNEEVLDLLNNNSKLKVHDNGDSFFVNSRIEIHSCDDLKNVIKM